MRFLLLPILLGTSFFAFGQELVRNGSFQAAASQVGAVPPEWSVAPEGALGWGFVNDDGLMDNETTANAVLFSAGENTGHLQQVVKCKPNTPYVLRVAMKANGCLPGIEVVAENGRKLLAMQGDANRHGLWKRLQGNFNSGQNHQLTICLLGSIVPGTGSSVFDQVSIMSASEALAQAATRSDDPGIFVPPGTNIALHKPYVMSQAPNYRLCADPGDATQLTDGHYTEGYFWAQKSTVGWGRATSLAITIDLGQEEPISGVSWNTAAGGGGVYWPSSGAHVYVSSDHKNWFYQGDLSLLGTVRRIPPTDRYAVFRFATDKLQTKGRWVQFVVNHSSLVCCDEIEVYRGKDDWLKLPAGEEATATPANYYRKKLLDNGVRRRLQYDLQCLDESIASLAADTTGKSAALAKITSLRTKMQQLPAVDQTSFAAVVPFNRVHQEILALNAVCLQVAGIAAPFLWQNNRWDDVSIIAVPPISAAADSLQVAMMRREVRGETVNISNPYDYPLEYVVASQGLPAEANLQLHEALTTDTSQGQMVTAALQPTASDDGSLRLIVPAGCTRQIWLSFHRPTLPNGTYEGRLKFSAANQPELSLAVQLRIAGQFPETVTLHVGGWDYLHGQANYFLAPGNLTDNLALLRDMYVDSPWIKSVLPGGAEFADDGRLTNAEQLDFTIWDEWVERWSGARQYCACFPARKTFHGEPMGTERFNRMLADYVTAWVNHLPVNGLQPQQLVILLLDEPRSHEQDKLIIAWAKAIKAANTGLRLFEDPIYDKPEEGLPDMYRLSDILCPKATQILAHGKPFVDFYRQQQADGRELWLYSCSGPARLLDPVNYYRAQKWRAFEIDAKGSFFWAFGCGGGIGDSWKPYLQTITEYSPYFVSQTSVMAAKQSEAIREGIQDHEYLLMLQKRIQEKEKQGFDAQLLAEAKKLLAEAPSRALAEVKASNLPWRTPKDRSLMDKVRMEIFNMLARLE